MDKQEMPKWDAMKLRQLRYRERLKGEPIYDQLIQQVQLARQQSLLKQDGVKLPRKKLFGVF